MKLLSNSYGKQRVRVMKVLRAAERHEVKELDVGVRLEGDFDASYTAADNRLVVPTDTVKNTVHVLAHSHLGPQTEPFALLLVQHFLERYPQIERVAVETSECRWLRFAVDGKPHGHTFLGDRARSAAWIVGARGAAAEIDSGVEDLLVMKSTGSGFAGFPKDGYTTLPETNDRILATEIRARWTWKTPPENFNATNAAVLDSMLRVFALEFSPSVQTTLFAMASAALSAFPGISRVSLALPNKHYLRANLLPFDLENPNVTFVPTDEPYGLIEAVVAR
jgi:urate oxidase